MTVSVTINGATLQAQEGMTVLEAARAHDIYIPTLCYAPNLHPAGACRMCVVHIEDMRGFPTACTVPVQDGMVVHTETESVQNLRREILSLILSEHPYTCLVCPSDCGAFHGGTIRKAAVTTGCQYCPANGQCALQELVDYLDLQDIPYPISYRGLPVEHHDPFFDRDYNLCVLCGRCVRTCQEVRHAGVLAFVKRGNDAIVGTAFGRSHLETDCQFCGACVDACPTGALADKRGKWEGVPTAVVPSVCPYCSVGCAVNIQVKDGSKVIRAVGRDEGPANAGQLCVRGRFGVVDVVHSLKRLKSPMVRREGRLIEVAWDEALNLVAESLSRYQSAEEADRFALIASATASNEESYALQKLARTVMKSNNVALSSAFPEYENTSELAASLKRMDATTIRDIRHADCIVCIGSNVLDSHPILGLEILHALKTRDVSLLSIDTRHTRLSQQADLWLQPRMATDHVLLSGLVKALVDRDEVAHKPEFPDLDLDEVASITGVAQGEVVRAAQLLAEHLAVREDQQPAVLVIYGSGVTHHPTAMQAISAIHNLAFVVDQAFGPGRLGIIGVPGEGNFVGAHDLGLHPALLPGYRPVSDPEARASFEAAWGTSLNPKPGRSYQSILEGIRTGHIQALFLAGEAPPLPDLAGLDFLVVQDIVSTETMQFAHVVLPSTTFAEMDGTLTNLEGRVQRLRQAITPLGSSRPGWMIARDLARGMGDTSWDISSAAEVMDEIAALVPAYAEVNYDTLGMEGMLRRFVPAEEEAQRLLPVQFEGIPQFTGDEFPLTLITERNLFYYHGACLTEQVPGMNLIKQEEILYLSSKDTGQLGVSDGDLVKVVSAHGSNECIVRVVNGMLPQRVAFASFNRMSSSPLFPTLTPDAKAYAIRIEIGT